MESESEGAMLPLLPTVAATASRGPTMEHAFCLGIDGTAVAWANGHGSDLTWL